jgi:hypothetical protein
MNPFMKSTKRAIDRNGKDCTLIKVTEGELDTNTMTASNTEVSHSCRMFKNHLKANQFHFPNLIGKDAAEFYLCNWQLTFVPEVKDKIVYDTKTYVIDSINENHAGGELVLYRLIAVSN